MAPHKETPTEIPLGEPKDFDGIVFNWMRTFAEIVDLTNKKHYDTEHTRRGMINAINAFVSTLDPHSNFLDPETYQSMEQSTSGEFFGVGIVIDNTRKPKDKFLTIVDTIPDGPADKAGLKPMDKIMEVDGLPLEGISTEEAITKLKGKRHSTVEIKVLRDKQNELMSFTITRDIIQEKNSLSFHIKEPNIFYLSLTQFSRNATAQMEALLKKSQENKYRGIILDLRNNSGGLLSTAIEIAALFLQKGSLVVTTKDKNNLETERYQTSKNPIADGSIPIFILINNYTASAAEILAGCLKIHSDRYSKETTSGDQDRLMAFLVGTKTFGKGSVQEVIQVSNNSAVKITTSLYFLPDDTTIQGIGIEPDFEIERCTVPTEQMQWLTKYYGREHALEHYIKTDKAKQEEAKRKEERSKKKETDQPSRWQERAKEMLQSDNQLHEAITLINILSNFKKCDPETVHNRENALKFLKNNYVTTGSLTIEEVKL